MSQAKRSLILMIPSLSFAILVLSAWSHYETRDHQVPGLELRDKIKQANAQTKARLAELQSLLAANNVSPREFANRLNDEILTPSEMIRSRLAENEKTLPKWLQEEISRQDFFHSSLEAIRDIYIAKDQLLTAENLIASTPQAAEAELNLFWSQTLPHLKKRLSTYQSEDVAHSPHFGDDWIKVRNGLAQDIRELTDSAIEIEILHTEKWLRSLKASIQSKGPRVIASTPSRSSSTPLKTVVTDVDSQLRRLNEVTGRLETQNDRLVSIQTYLQRLQSALR